MRKYLQTILIFTVLIMFFGAVTQVSAQKVGGYKEISNEDETALAAADFAVNTKAEKDELTLSLVSLEKAERQTVAGANYRLCLKIEVTEDEEKTQKQVLVVVYQNLQRVFSLTSWTEKECAE